MEHDLDWMTCHMRLGKHDLLLSPEDLDIPDRVQQAMSGALGLLGVHQRSGSGGRLLVLLHFGMADAVGGGSLLEGGRWF
jgi:hypothetical protein